jgi:hypothetical protein
VRWLLAWDLVSWSSKLVVGQSPAGRNVSTDAENTYGNRLQETTDEDTAGREDLLHAVVNCRVCELAIELWLLVVTICV